MKQNYSNHIRYYTAHHFVFYPVICMLFSMCCYQAYHDRVNTFLWLMLACVIAVLGWLSFMLRQHYALGNQNRIVRLEMRLRYYRLTHKNFEDLEKQLSLSQLYALRFAPDDELLLLIERTLQQNLQADEIKKSVVNWLPDEMRL